MSKYISTRLETINTQSLVLNDLNSYLQSYIELLENISKEHKSFIVLTHKENLDYNSSIFVYTICLEFNFLSKRYILNIHNFNHIKESNAYPEDLKHIMITIVNQINNAEKFHIAYNKLLHSRSLFHQIDKLYYEINKKTGEFNKESLNVINYCKQFAEKQSIENDDQYTYIYLKNKRNHKMEYIDFSNQKNKDNACFQLRLPILKEIEKIYLEKRQNLQYDKTLYIKIFKEEFIRLNQYFCNIFLINMEDIYFNFNPRCQDFNREYKDISYEFKISLKKEKILKLSQKLLLEEQMNNF